jgi:enterochelin esterase-like enzyme
LGLLVLALWIGLGLFGTFRYVHGYWLFRGFPPPRTPAGLAKGTRSTLHFHSVALHHDRFADVYLPPGYRSQVAAGRRFGVLYLLHGNPGQPAQLFRIGAAATVADTLIARRRIAPMILVVPDGRSSGYGAHTEWADAGAGAFDRYLVDVVRATDRHYATIADRRHRALAGLSEGAFGAANVTLHHLSVFGAFQSWSGYFTETAKGPFAGATQARLAANSPASYVPRLAPVVRRLGLRAFLYQGMAQRSGTAEIRSFAAELRAAGVQVGLGLYRGGHDWGLWRRQLPHMLEVADGWFAPPARPGPMRGPR